MLSRPPFWLADVDELLGRLGQVVALLDDDRVHDGRLDHVGQAVGIEQIDVVGLGPVLDDVGRDDRLDAQRARDEVLVQRESRLLRRQLAAVDLLLQQRMIARQLLELLAAQPVAAGVADVADADPIAAEHEADERRAHPGALGTRLRRLVDALVRHGDLLLEEQRGMREAARDVDLRQLAVGLELRQHAAADDVDRDAAGDLAGVVAAHAVGEHRDAGRGIDENGILVVGADHPLVGQHGAIECTDVRASDGFGDCGRRPELTAPTSAAFPSRPDCG